MAATRIGNGLGDPWSSGKTGVGASFISNDGEEDMMSATYDSVFEIEDADP